MLQNFLKAVAQLGDPALRGVLWIGILGSLLLFVGLWIGLWFLFAAVDASMIPGVAWLETAFGAVFDWLAGLVYFAALLMATLLLFPAVVTVVVGLFLERVVEAVEARHYPGQPPARPQPVAEVVWSTVRFAMLTVGLNLLALPLYALLLFLPPLNIVLFYMLNGYLVSREYYELVALRRMTPGAARQLRRAHGGRLTAAGCLLVFVMTIPIVNLLTPVLATAFMVHVFQALPRRGAFVEASRRP